MGWSDLGEAATAPFAVHEITPHKNQRLPNPRQFCSLSVRLCAVSSVVEHYLDTVGVTGSNPVSRTIFLFSRSWIS